MKTITINGSSEGVKYLREKDHRLATLMDAVGEIQYRTHSDGYAFLVHEILEQMLSIRVASIISDRLAQLCGGNVSIEAIKNITDDEMKTIGTSYRKVKSIRDLTIRVDNGELNLNDLIEKSDTEVISSLTSVYGIGQWTAKMYLIFVLDRQDVLPYEDAAFLQAYRWLYETSDISPESVKERCKKWSPFSSVASRYMYRALDSGLVKGL